MASTASGKGYWLVGGDGGIFSFGDAKFYGSTGALRLKAPVLGMLPTATGKGYYLYARDGGIFTFGDAKFMGSTGALRLRAPVVSMAARRKETGIGWSPPTAASSRSEMRRFVARLRPPTWGAGGRHVAVDERQRVRRLALRRFGAVVRRCTQPR